MIDGVELIKDVWERRRMGLCSVQRRQDVYKRVTVQKENEKPQVVLKFVITHYLDHKNDRTDRDVCTECGDAMFNGILKKQEEDFIES